MAHLLCELYVRLGVAGLVDGPSFSFPITQVQLGDALGMSAVHVNRVLQELRGENLFTWQGQTVRILDWEGLQQRAEFDPRYLHLNIESR
jgi:CRP-like cAMP-binding protein